MIELEIYAAGLRDYERIMQLDQELETVADMRYKVDPNHDIVYMEFDQPTLSIQEIRALFRRLGLDPKVVGQVPPELRSKTTQRIDMKKQQEA